MLKKVHHPKFRVSESGISCITLIQFGFFSWMALPYTSFPTNVLTFNIELYIELYTSYDWPLNSDQALLVTTWRGILYSWCFDSYTACVLTVTAVFVLFLKITQLFFCFFVFFTFAQLVYWQLHSWCFDRTYTACVLTVTQLVYWQLHSWCIDSYTTSVLTAFFCCFFIYTELT